MNGKYEPDDINARLALLINNADETKAFRKELKSQLDDIQTHVRATNGKIAEQERQIAELKNLEAKRGQDLKDIIQGKRFVQRYLFNRYFLVGSGVFLFGLFKILANEESRGFLFRLLGL